MREIQEGQLGLTAPVQNGTVREGIPLTVKEVEHWRNELPMADTSISAKKIYDLIIELNQAPIQSKDRFQILELLRAPVQFLCQNLKKHYLYQITSLTPRKITIAQFSETLQTEMAYGYKIILNEYYPWSHQNDELRNLVATSIHRVFHYFGQIILRKGQLYTQLPKGLWNEIHRLYQHAENEKLLKEPILSGQYEHLILFSVSDPYKWRQIDQENLFNILDRWVGFLQTIRTPPTKPEQDEGRWIIIHPRDDMPPALFMRDQDIPPIEAGCLFINLSKLLEHLKQVLTVVETNETNIRAARSPNPEYRLPAPLLKSLIQTLESQLERQIPRITRDQEVQVCIGLSAVHYYVSGKHLFQSTGEIAFGQTESEAYSIPKTAEVETTTPPSVISAEPTTEKPEEEAIDISFIPLPEQKSFIKLNEFKTTKCTLINDHTTGYCLLWSGDAYPPIQGGDLIGIQSGQTESAPWEVGVVRWFKHDEKLKARIGIELLGEKPKAGSIQLIKEGQPSGQFLRCLLFKDRVVTPSLPFRQGHHVMIRQLDANGDTYTMESDLNKLLESTGSHKVFELLDKEARMKLMARPKAARLIETHEPKKAPPKPSEGGDPFDNLWTNL